MHPDQVAADPRMTLADKRALLASWASDARALAGAPALRQLDNGAVVRVADILRVLNTLDDDGAQQDGEGQPAAPGTLRQLVRLRRRLKSALRRTSSDDDDDDPPPCPALVRLPLGGPLSGGATAVAAPALAA